MIHADTILATVFDGEPAFLSEPNSLIYSPLFKLVYLYDCLEEGSTEKSSTKDE